MRKEALSEENHKNKHDTLRTWSTYSHPTHLPYIMLPKTTNQYTSTTKMATAIFAKNMQKFNIQHGSSPKPKDDQDTF
jgi:hypothetical protein